MVVHKLRLERGDNPEYYALTDEQPLLMDRWNQVHNQLYAFRVPRLWLFGTKRNLLLVGADISQLQRDFLDWYKRVRKFCVNPHYKTKGTLPGDRRLIYLHCTATLRNLMNKLDSDMLMLAGDYNHRYSESEGRLNFLIAMVGLIIALVGLALSISGVSF